MAAYTLVYRWCMARTNIDIDERLCQQIMDRYQLSSKREAVDLALRYLVGEPFGVADARALRGSGWTGDLETLRSSRV